jgi:hypothetical protein
MLLRAGFGKGIASQAAEKGPASESGRAGALLVPLTGRARVLEGAEKLADAGIAVEERRFSAAYVI